MNHKIQIGIDIGAVSSALLSWVEKEHGIPVINLFYEGSAARTKTWSRTSSTCGERRPKPASFSSKNIEIVKIFLVKPGATRPK